ncbi:MAG: hypothetical protein H3C35_01220 [Bacteroidetes bacterium]|nr:hypothetical protein [Bacteroidota bacterium]
MKKWKSVFLLTALTICFAGAQEKTVNTTPKFSGYIRTWQQSDFSTHQSQFLVKMARVGVAGNVNQFASYKFLVDAAPLGKFAASSDTLSGKKILTSASSVYPQILLDAYSTITPVENISFSLGQFKVPFSTDNLRGGASLDFVNRPLLTSVAPALRDVGFSLSYKGNGNVPSEFTAGIFNGTGQNKLEDDRSATYAGRLSVSPVKGANVSANYYGGKNGTTDVSIYDFGFDWACDNFFVDGEFAMRASALPAGTITSSAYFVYVLYAFVFEGSEIQSVIPAVRYEQYDANTAVTLDEVSRITAGVSLEFAKLSFAQFRVNYEKFNYAGGAVNPDKLIFEIQTRF